MKITISNNKLVPFEKVAEGTVFKVPKTEDYYIKIIPVAYYIKTIPVANENTDEEEWNCLRLDDYTLDCCSPSCTVLPIDNAELIIP